MSVTPPLLRRGDRVRIVAPSGVFSRERFDAGCDLLRAAGLEPVFDDGLFACDRYLAGDDARRLEELRRALVEPDIAALWMARGGYGATRLLPSLTPELVAEHARWFIGFSDATALHALWQRAGVGSLHGANVTTLPSWSAAAREELFAMLMEGGGGNFGGVSAGAASRVEGPLVGGNLTVLAAMAGTGQLPPSQGAVILLEDIGERPYRLDRSLTQLRQAGWLAGAAGFAVGQLTGCVDPDGVEALADALEVVVGELRPQDVPIVTGLSLGHEASSRAVPLGRIVTLDGRDGTLSVRSATAVAPTV